MPLIRAPRPSTIGAALVVLLVLQVTGLLVPRSASPPVTAAAPRATSSPVLPRPTPTPTPIPARATVTVDPPTQQPVPSVLVTGRVVDEAGRPVGGAAVLSSRHHGGFERLTTAVSAVASLGLICAVGACDTDMTRDTTDPDGHFELHLPLSGDLGKAGRHDLTVALPDGSTTLLAHDYQGRPVSLGTVHVLRTRPSVTRSAGSVHISMPSVPRSLGSDLSPSEVFFDNTQKPALTVRGTSVIDGRLLEQGVTTMRFTVHGKDAFGREVSYSGGTTPVPDGPTPLSRDRDCSGYGPRDAPVPLPGCHFTDGQLSAMVGPDVRLGDLACQAQKRCTAHNESVLLDLGHVQGVSAVVLHGCTFDCSVEVSNDDRFFAEAARTAFGHDDDVLLPLSRHQARWVRITYGFSIDLSNTREASVF